jgi:hypothetical protein
MAYPCPSCDGTQTAAVYFHRCANRNWLTVRNPAPNKSPITGKPAPIQCPDGLVEKIDPLGPPATLTLSARGSGCVDALTGMPTSIDPRVLYCYTCKVITAFPATGAG